MSSIKSVCEARVRQDQDWLEAERTIKNGKFVKAS